MRDGGVYSGDPRENKLLPLPRPTYTGHQRVPIWNCTTPLRGVLDHASAIGIDYRSYAVPYAGASGALPKSEHGRHHFFKPNFKRGSGTSLARNRARSARPTATATPDDELLHDDGDDGGRRRREGRDDDDDY